MDRFSQPSITGDSQQILRLMMNLRLLLVMLSLILPLQGGAVNIFCGGVVDKPSLDFIRKELHYVGTEAFLHCAYGTNEVPYRVVRKFRHKKTNEMLIWAQDRGGFVREIFVGKLEKGVAVDLQAIKWKHEGSVQVSPTNLAVVSAEK